MNEECAFCHPQTVAKDGREYGKTIRETTEFWNWVRKRKPRKKTLVRIMNPNNKHPKLRANMIYTSGPEGIFDLSIHFCPYCGREFGKVENHD